MLGILLLFATTGVDEVEELGGSSVLVLEIAGEGELAGEARALDEILAGALAENCPLRVVTGNDLKQMLALEAEKQTLGCDRDESSCLSELADAMGSDFVLSGTLNELGGAQVLSLTLFDNARAKAAGRQLVEVAELAQVLPAVERAVIALFGTATTDEPVAAPETGGLLTVTTLATGSALMIGGGATWFVSDLIVDERLGVNKDQTRLVGFLGVGAFALGVVTTTAGVWLAVGGE